MPRRHGPNGSFLTQIRHSRPVPARFALDGATVDGMWDTVETNQVHLSHDLPCSECGHGRHTYLPCSDTCTCAHGRDRVLSYA